MEKPNVYFVSLGCPKNLVDSQVMLGKLEQKDYFITQQPENADVIIVNTCSFIQAAKEESIETILEMADYKEKGQCKALVVSGCLPQRYSAELEKQMPEIDLMIGTGQYHRITEILENRDRALKEGAKHPPRSYIDFPAFIHTEKDARVHTGPAHSAFLKLSEGCNRRCAFCIIPTLRGNVRSRTIDSLVEEATALAANGVKELNLVAQDLTHYGIETRYKENLEELLPRLCRIEGIEWIRLHYVYPDEFSDELVEIVASEPKIVKYLDMPIQHTNDRVLKSMNRRLTKERLFKLIDSLRARIPNIVFRTSMIVGFPSETEEEFQELCSDLTRLNLDHVGVFSYSKEEGTRAAEMTDQVNPSVRRRRQRHLIKILQEQRNQRMDAAVGTTAVVMVEGAAPESDLLIEARLPTQAQEIDGRILINDLGTTDIATIRAGDFVTVEITERANDDLIARLVSPVSAGLTIQGHRKNATRAAEVNI